MASKIQDVFKIDLFEIQKMDSISILIVDDKPVQSALTSLFLKQLGHSVDLASDGFEALSSVQNNGCYDVVLVDCEMSLMDGFEAIRLIREMDKVIGLETYLVGFGSSSISEKVLSAGMNEYLIRPLNKLVLKAILGQQIRQNKNSDSREIPVSD